MGVHDARVIDTRPGGSPDDPFSPPPGWEGGQEAYWELLRERWDELKWGQRLRISVRIATQERVTVKGPYAKTATRLMTQLLEKRNATGLFEVIPA
jgi:hypothetical protein